MEKIKKMEKLTKEQLEQLDLVYIGVTEDTIVDSNHRPFIQTENGKMYLSTRYKYDYTASNK